MSGSPAGRRVLEAPGKINLGLSIVGRRADGYHLLESFFAPLELADTVELALEPSGSGVELSLEDAAADVPAGAQNLAVRAARAFVEAAGGCGAVRIRLVKRIPSGGGLGGGSSDAALVLRALDELAPGRVAAERLAALALSLGADVPYFLDPRPAWVSGIGERIEPWPGVPALPLLLANPGEALATAEVFRQFATGDGALTGGAAGSTMRSLLEVLARRGLSTEAFVAELARHPEGLRNDLLGAATGLCPSIAFLLQQLRELGASHVGMSGSGATVYGLFGAEAAAEEALERGRRRGLFGGRSWAMVSRTLASREA